VEHVCWEIGHHNPMVICCRSGYCVTPAPASYILFWPCLLTVYRSYVKWLTCTIWACVSIFYDICTVTKSPNCIFLRTYTCCYVMPDWTSNRYANKPNSSFFSMLTHFW
jgi:hypothetical protein